MSPLTFWQCGNVSRVWLQTTHTVGFFLMCSTKCAQSKVLNRSLGVEPGIFSLGALSSCICRASKARSPGRDCESCKKHDRVDANWKSYRRVPATIAPVPASAAFRPFNVCVCSCIHVCRFPCLSTLTHNKECHMIILHITLY